MSRKAIFFWGTFFVLGMGGLSNAAADAVPGGIECSCLGKTDCSGVICDDPPDNYCIDTGSALMWASNGYCTSPNSTPQCNYGRRQYFCEDYCVDGVCECDSDGCDYNDDLYSGVGGMRCVCAGQTTCAGVSCRLPPEDYCIDAQTVMEHASVGYCNLNNGEAQCLYQQREWTCDEPPADVCTDENTLLQYDLMGSCRDGACEYTPAEVNCDLGCVDGACVEPALCNDYFCDMVAIEKILINASGDIPEQSPQESA